MDPDLVVFKLSKMKVMVASKICEPAHTLKEEPEFDSNKMETKLKTPNKRRKITYYTVSILGMAALGIAACLLVNKTSTFTWRIKDRKKEAPYVLCYPLWGFSAFVFIMFTQLKLNPIYQEEPLLTVPADTASTCKA